MSLFNTMQTSISGMAAQSNALGAIGDNIANVDTVGYKSVTAEFENLIGMSGTSDYQSGGVLTDIRYGISEQGTLEQTTSPTDLAIEGNGFFCVSQGGQGTYLTRAGSFVPDSSGNLVNAAGYDLMGYAMGPNGTSNDLSVINVSSTTLQASASTTGSLTGNLDSTSSVVTGDTAADNQADSQYTSKSSVTVYDKLGKADVLDVYMTKTADNTWQVAVYQQADAASGGGFPYSSGPLATTNLNFDPTTGNLASGSPTSLSVSVPGGNSVPIDMSGLTQLASSYSVQGSADGGAPSKLDHVSIGTDGTVNAVYGNGDSVALYKIPLATVTSPNNLTSLNGDVFQANQDSGPVVLSSAGQGGTGQILSGELEESTVDLATELTNMIVYQRGYEANSKVLQTSANLLDVINQLQIST